MGKKFLDFTPKHITTLGVSPEPEELKLLIEVTGHTGNHNRYLRAIDGHRVTFCLGPAGTGKTWMAAGRAATMLVKGEIKKIVITRPMVVCGKDIGFLPGDKNAKVGPYMRPLLDALDDFLGPKVVDQLIESEVIDIQPLELLRGSNMRDSFIILDEAQNVERDQLRMFLTRFSKGSKVVVTGDETQTDLPHGGQNPLARGIELMLATPHEKVAICRLDHSDVMRDELTSYFDTVLSEQPYPHKVEQEREPALPEPEIFVETCDWCSTECGTHDENPIQFECWSCTSLTSIDEQGKKSHSFNRDGACSKTFEVVRVE